MSFAFWVSFLVMFIFAAWWHWRYDTPAAKWGLFAINVVLFALLFALGWKVFVAG